MKIQNKQFLRRGFGHMADIKRHIKRAKKFTEYSFEVEELSKDDRKVLFDRLRHNSDIGKIRAGRDWYFKTNQWDLLPEHWLGEKHKFANAEGEAIFVIKLFRDI